MPRWERSPLTRVVQTAALFAAFGLALSATLSAPLFRGSGYLVVTGKGSGGTSYLGTFGWCNNEGCSKWSVGYNAGEAVLSVLGKTTDIESHRGATRCLLMTPLVALFALLAAIISAIGSSIWTVMWTVILALVTCVLSVAATAFDAWLFTTLGQRAKEKGAVSVKFGIAMWMLWGATVLALLVPLLAVVEAFLTRKRRHGKRGAYRPVSSIRSGRESVYTESSVALYDYERDSVSRASLDQADVRASVSRASVMYPSTSVSSVPSSPRMDARRGSVGSVGYQAHVRAGSVGYQGHARSGSVGSMQLPGTDFRVSQHGALLAPDPPKYQSTTDGGANNRVSFQTPQPDGRTSEAPLTDASAGYQSWNTPLANRTYSTPFDNKP